MTGLDRKLRQTAVNLVNKYGKVITHTAVSEGSYDPITGTVTPANTDYSIKAIVEDYKGIELVSGQIQHGDVKITMPAKGNTKPDPNDKITIDSIVYMVVSVKSVWSGEMAAIYELQVRK